MSGPAPGAADGAPYHRPMPRPEDPDSWDHVPRNLATISERIAEAAHAARREADDISLVAVSKTFPVDAIEAALDAGQTLFGENRVQEALPKIEALAKIDALSGSPEPGRARFHLVGHLQTNKARNAGAFDMIESVDSVRLAAALDCRLFHPIPVLLEVNVVGEASKHGFAPADLPDALTAIRPLGKLAVVGLMTVAPLVADPEEVRPVFRELRRLRDGLRRELPGLEQLSMGQLSMGMTNDFTVAIAEGATIVRIGRAIFGDR